MRKKILAMLLATITLVTLIACQKTIYTVTFDSNGGTPIEAVEVESGKIIEVQDPEKDGWIFQGWFEGDTEFDFTTTPIERNLTVKAKWDSTDKIPPAFIGAIAGKLPELEHLKGEEIALDEGVRVRDETTKEEDVVVEIVDLGGYDKDTPGVYTIKFEATDEAGNKSTATRQITVHDTLVREYSAVVIGDKFSQYVYNNETALKYESWGTNFRMYDVIQVMEKDVFVDQYDLYYEEHTNNGLVPYFPNGVLVLLDEDMKVVQVRIAAGTLVQINAEGELDEEITWTNAVDATNGGGLFKGLIDEIDTLLPGDGYLMFVGNIQPEDARKFLISSFFNTEYSGGAISAEEFNVDVTALEIKLEDVKEVIKLPDRLDAPVLTIEEGFLKWNEVANAGSYQIYINDEVVLTTTKTSVSLASFELEPSDEPYVFEAVTVTPDMYVHTSSLKSEPVEFVQRETLEAPTLTVVGSLVSWEAVEGAVSYNVYLTYFGENILLGNVETVEFNVEGLAEGKEGINDVFVVAVAEDEGLNSAPSDAVSVFFGEIQSFVIGNATTDILVTTSENYFRRRNALYPAGFASAPYLFLLNDIHEILDEEFPVTANEAFSTVVLLDKDGKTKAVNAINTGQTWTIETGWALDAEYVNNNAQIANLLKYIVEDDMLLIGKNSNMLNVQVEDGGIVEAVNSRHFVSHFYVKANADDNFNGEAWRDAIDTFLDPTNVTFEITDRVEVEEPEDPVVEEYNTLKVGENEIEILFNEEGQLTHTSSGAVFRTKDKMQVMSKDFFLTEYEIARMAPGYATNGQEVFFNNGILVVVDKDFNVVLIRMAVGNLAEVKAGDSVKTTDLTWTNGQDATNGGGIFAGITDELETVIPEGGYLIFTAPGGDNTARTFAVQNMFQSDYVSGAVTIANKDINITEIVLELLDK